MKKIFEKILLLLLLALGLTSCESGGFYAVEDEIIGSWSSVYKDETVFEEEVYDFDPTGRWTYRYIYDNIAGDYIYEVDAGTYYISYGQLKLKSNFTDDIYSLSVSIYDDRMVLRSGDYRAEFVRYR